jgi:phosphatidylglycerol:prolipoprotein diacylglycerol transferase
MIPSPSINAITIGPLTIHFYGIIIALAIITCYTLTLKLAKKKNISEKEVDHYYFITLPVAFIGARLYHVATNLSYYTKHPNLIPAVWNGGLGIMGGIIATLLMTVLISKKQKRPFLEITDLLAIVLPLGHAIGRWGNYFNQELFGKPTTLPWGLQIAPPNRPKEYLTNTTFHPTFLYESLLNLINFAILYWLYTHKQLKKGTTTALYLINYGIIRFTIELVKIDPDISAQLGPLRVPQYVSLLFVIAGIALLLYTTQIKKQIHN